MIARIRKLVWVLLLGAVAVALLPGCDGCKTDKKKESTSAVENYPQDFLRKQWPQGEGVAARIVRRAYRIRTNDKLEIIYNIKTREDPEDYRLQVRDVINVGFPFDPKLNISGLGVQSDGTVQLNLIGTLKVSGMTVTKLTAKLNKLYKKYIKNPQITVTFKESNRDIADLREAITTAPRGQSRLVPVAPDGMIALPLIGSVEAAGTTVDQVYELVNKRYHDLGIMELSVTVNLEYISPLQVYVLGEVWRPGLVFSTLGAAQNVTELSLIQAIAQAGSYKPKRAELSKVLLLRKHTIRQPNAAIINVGQLLDNQVKGTNVTVVADSAKFRYDVWLEDGDIVYVPTTALAKRADYIEYVWTRGIYAIVPITFSANYAAQDAVDWLGPNP
ncbi:MAG: polysaccharide biosynthesis/export family protein [Phycisphaerae bacterium]|nr:polysaccharide biosynthesis/export family protein [Phycisphaerae bacterium]